MEVGPAGVGAVVSTHYADCYAATSYVLSVATLMLRADDVLDDRLDAVADECDLAGRRGPHTRTMQDFVTSHFVDAQGHGYRRVLMLVPQPPPSTPGAQRQDAPTSSPGRSDAMSEGGEGETQEDKGEGGEGGPAAGGHVGVCKLAASLTDEGEAWAYRCMLRSAAASQCTLPGPQRGIMAAYTPPSPNEAKAKGEWHRLRRKGGASAMSSAPSSASFSPGSSPSPMRLDAVVPALAHLSTTEYNVLSGQHHADQQQRQRAMARVLANSADNPHLLTYRMRVAGTHGEEQTGGVEWRVLRHDVARHGRRAVAAHAARYWCSAMDDSGVLLVASTTEEAVAMACVAAGMAHERRMPVWATAVPAGVAHAHGHGLGRACVDVTGLIASMSGSSSGGGGVKAGLWSDVVQNVPWFVAAACLHHHHHRTRTPDRPRGLPSLLWWLNSVEAHGSTHHLCDSEVAALWGCVQQLDALATTHAPCPPGEDNRYRCTFGPPAPPALDGLRFVGLICSAALRQAGASESGVRQRRPTAPGAPKRATNGMRSSSSSTPAYVPSAQASRMAGDRAWSKGVHGLVQHCAALSSVAMPVDKLFALLVDEAKQLRAELLRLSGHDTAVLDGNTTSSLAYAHLMWSPQRMHAPHPDG